MTKPKKLPDVYEMTDDQRIDMLIAVQGILWCNEQGDTVTDPEWGASTLERIDQALAALRPVEVP